MIDPINPTSMDLDISKVYATWWYIVIPTSLGIYKEEEDEDMATAPLKKSSYEDEQNIDNPMHDIIVQEQPSILTLGLEILVESQPLYSIGKTLFHTCMFMTFSIF